MELQYWIRREGRVRGPYSADKLVAASKAGKTNEGDSIATSESGPWHDLGRWLKARIRTLAVSTVRYHAKPFGLSLLGAGATVSYPCPKCNVDCVSDVAAIEQGDTCERCKAKYVFSSNARLIVEQEVAREQQMALARREEKNARRAERAERDAIQREAAQNAASAKQDRKIKDAAEAQRKRAAITPEHKKLRKMRFAARVNPLCGFLMAGLGLVILGAASQGQQELRSAIAAGDVERTRELSLKGYGDQAVVAWGLIGFAGFCVLSGLACWNEAKKLADKLSSEEFD